MARDDDAERARAEAIDAEYEPAYRREERQRGVSGGAALLLALVAAGVGAAGGAVAPRLPAVAAALDNAFPAANQGEQAAASGEDGESVAQRLAAIEAVLNAPLAVAASDDVADGGTAARVFALQAGLRDIETQLERMPTSAEVNALVAEVRQLQEELPAVAAEARQAATAARASYTVVAASEASRSSGPFEQAYAALAALLPEDPNVVALAPLARTGAPTRGELREQFDRLDIEIVRAAHQARAGAGFWGQIQATLAQWIVVRRAGGGDTPDAIVARAEQRLAADDLGGAIEQLNQLSGAPKRVAQPWLTDAQRRLEIDQRIAAIRQELSRS